MAKKITSLAHRMRHKEYQENLERLEYLADEVMILRAKVAQLERGLDKPTMLAQTRDKHPLLTIAG